MKEFLEQFTDKNNEVVEYIAVHTNRYILSYNYIKEYLYEGMKILELGDRSKFADFIVSNHGCIVDNIKTDLRYDFNIETNSYDFILNMEVLEHIKDKNEDNEDFHLREKMTFSGMKSLLSECNRILKPDKLMFLTTPNASSVAVILNVIDYKSPFDYPPHVRELSIFELRELVKDFQILKLDTIFSWYPNRLENYNKTLETLKELGVSCENRGDNILTILKKNI